MDSSFSSLPAPSADLRTALVIGHPGHELLVHGWLETTRPQVFVFTDGSGRSNQSRLGSTSKILKQTGAWPGDIYGRLTDAASYAAILNSDFDLFRRLSTELSDAFIAEGINFVAGDALEGYNPMHDVCRLMINAAVAIASREHGQPIANFEFSLLHQSTNLHNPSPSDCAYRKLDEAALARKLAAAKDYAELAGEVNARLDEISSDIFAIECMWPTDQRVDPEVPPFYEQYGEKQVAAGYYSRVIRYHEHIEPLAEALKCHAQNKGG